MTVSTEPSVTRPDQPTGSTWKIYLMVLLAFGALYWATTQRGAGWQDSGMHQLRILRGQYTNPFGLALAHPLHIALGQPLRLLGSARVPTAMNMLSGLAMAVAVANVYLLGHRLTGRHGPAVVAAGMLGISHTAWWLATITETYCLVAAGLTTELLLLHSLITRPRWRTAALLGLVNGLGLSLHNLALLALVVYAVVVVTLVVRRRLPVASLAATTIAWLIGASGLLILVIGHGISTGDWPGTIHSALFGQSWQQNVSNLSTKAIGWAIIYIGLNWPFVSLAPVLLGWWVMRRRVGGAVAAAFTAIAAIHLVFAVRYNVPDQFMFLLPSHIMLAVGAAVGLERIVHMRQPWRRLWVWAVAASILLTPVLYGLTPILLTTMNQSIRSGRTWPYRNENRYWITPWKFDETSADHLGRRVFSMVEPNAVILPSGMATPPLQVIQLAEGLKPGVTIVDLANCDRDYHDDPTAFIDWLGGRPAYTVDAKPTPLSEAMLDRAEQTPMHPLIKVRFIPE